ncbi:MAG: hypothetical protein KME21_15570 [Desmonostoc vinosum HA7617-LM4]|nr:hypothetical protein [Desmonostoc vinosum HA7617-LM4]
MGNWELGYWKLVISPPALIPQLVSEVEPHLPRLPHLLPNEYLKIS